MLQIRWFRAMPSIRSGDSAPGAVPVPHKPWCHLTSEVADHLYQPVETKAGQDRGQTPSSWLEDVSEAAVTPTCHTWITRSCHHWGSLNTNAKAQGTAQTSEMCKYTNSCRQAHTSSLNDTENTCAVSLPYHKVTLWSVQIKMQNQLALVHIKYCMHSY